MTPVEFWSICSMNGLILDDEQMERLIRYATDLVHFNEKINLISRRDTPHVWMRHILHSLTPLMMDLLPSGGRLLDIGSGGGLPGIPLKIARPDFEVLLLDSIAKKVKTTEMLASHVVEHGLTVLRERAEEMPNHPDYADGFDVVVARAVAPLVDLITWARPILRPGGSMVLLKGGTLIDELEHATGKHPDAQITIHEIELIGLDWFARENKRIVTVRFDGTAEQTAQGAEVGEVEDGSDEDDGTPAAAGGDTGADVGTDVGVDTGADVEVPTPSTTGESGAVGDVETGAVEETGTLEETGAAEEGPAEEGDGDGDETGVTGTT